MADVALGPEMRRGIAELDGEGEVTGGIVIVRHHQNALMESCSDSINSHHVAAGVRSVEVDWPDDEQLFS